MKESRLIVACLASLVFSACAPSGEVTGEGSSGEVSSAAVSVPDLQVTVGNMTCQGELCPAGSTSVATAPDAFTMVFSQGVLGGTGAPLSGSAHITLDVDVPAGYQFSSGRFFARGFAQAGEPAGQIFLISRYSFAGSFESRFFTKLLTDTNDDFQTDDRPRNLWSPSCGKNAGKPVRIQVDLTAGVESTGLFTLDTLDGAFTVPEGLEWRRCGETDPIRPPASEKGAYCGGVNAQPCVAGLACEYTFEVAELGSCVDPQEVVPPAAKDEYCGGYRNIACQDGLVCRFASPRSIAEHRRGACTPAIGNVGDACGGTPAVPCAPELTCDANVNSCK